MANILKKFKNNFEDITEYYNYLVAKTKNHEQVDITNEWLIDNYYILAEHKNNIYSQKSGLKKNIKTLEENYYFLKAIANKKNYDINFKYLTDELKIYQKDTNRVFTYKELGMIIPTLIMIYIERLNDLCREEYKKIVDKEDVSKIIEASNDLTLDSFISEDFNPQNNTHYIFEINNQLYKVNKSSKLFKSLNEYLKEKQMSLKDIINEEFQNKIDNNVLIANIFNDLKEFFEFSTEDIYEKVSKTERKLLTDPIYKKMNESSKILYRNKLLSLAKKNHLDEYTYLEKIFESDEHIGFKLFKEKKSTFKVVLYILVLVLISGIIAFFASNYFIRPRILGFIILFVPICQLISQLLQEILIKTVPTSVIPKLDYSKGIPEESRTMVVIPTIVASKEKVKTMFDTLESYYLINKSDNLYFTLLGDVKALNEEIAPFDKEVSEYGEEYAKKLNAKYKKDIFFFIYRKRLWNEKENQYLGYERKRGALL